MLIVIPGLVYGGHSFSKEILPQMDTVASQTQMLGSNRRSQEGSHAKTRRRKEGILYALWYSLAWFTVSIVN